MTDTWDKTAVPSIYTPLAEKDEIRLLILQARTVSGDAVRCTLKNVKLSRKPVYEALSYMWGATDEANIELNGRAFSVRQSLYTALSYLRHEDQPRILWIDALCIDQQDISERTHQVAQMSSIYNLAYCVVVWLGPEQLAGDFRHYQPVMTSTLDSTQVAARKNDFPGFSVQDMLPDPTKRAGLDLTAAVNRVTILDLICAKQYWNRLWIIQEVLLASNILICLGNSSCGWHELSAAMTDTHHAPTLASRAARLRDDRRIGWQTSSPLVDLCCKYGQSKCQDQRDKIFGLHALADSCCRSASPVDYTVDCTSLFESVLVHHIQAHIRDWHPGSTIIREAYIFHENISAELDDCFDREPRHTDSLYPHHLRDTSFPVRGMIRGRLTHIFPLADQTPSRVTTGARLQAMTPYIRMQLIHYTECRERGQQTRRSVLTNRINLVDTVPDLVYNNEIPAAQNAVPTSAAISSLLPRNPLDDEIRQILLDARDVATRAMRQDCSIAFEETGLICFAPQGARVGDWLCQFTGTNVIALVRKDTTSKDDEGWKKDGPDTIVRGRCVDVLPSHINEPFEIGGDHSWRDEPEGTVVVLPIDMAILQMLTRASSKPDVGYQPNDIKPDVSDHHQKPNHLLEAMQESDLSSMYTMTRLRELYASAERQQWRYKPPKFIPA